MYDELIKVLRGCVLSKPCDDCPYYDQNGPTEQCATLNLAAADAIEELSKPKWVKIESRPMDEEERQYYSERLGYDVEYGDAVIYCCQLPEHGQNVLVCNEYGHIWIDTFDDDPDYGVGFETNGDMDGLVAWMPLPEPPESEDE